MKELWPRFPSGSAINPGGILDITRSGDGRSDPSSENEPVVESGASERNEESDISVMTSIAGLSQAVARVGIGCSK